MEPSKVISFPVHCGLKVGGNHVFNYCHRRYEGKVERGEENLGSVVGPVIQANWRLTFEVSRSPMLHYRVNQHPHWACPWYGYTGGTRGWLVVKICQLATVQSDIG